MQEPNLMGDEIRSIRKELGCEQKEFGRICDNSTASVSRWENAESIPEERTRELIQELSDRLNEVEDSETLKKKLLLASDLSDRYTALELLDRGELDDEIEYGLDDIELLETHYLESGLSFFDLTHRRIDHWLEQACDGAVEIKDLDSWQEVLRFVPYIEKLIATVLERNHQLHIDEEVQRKLGQSLGKFLRHESVIDEKLDQYIKPAQSARGYMDDLLVAVSALKQHFDQLENENKSDNYKNIEQHWWHIWPGEDSLEESIDHIIETVNDELLDEVNTPDQWKRLLNEPSD